MSIFDNLPAQKTPKRMSPDGAIQAIKVARTVRWWTEYEAVPSDIRETASRKMDPFFQRVQDGDETLWEKGGFDIQEPDPVLRRAMILQVLTKDWGLFETRTGFVITPPRGMDGNPWRKLEGV